MTTERTIVVFGSGPGNGNHIAAHFASKGFTHVILLARNETRLQDDKAFVQKASPNVKVDTLRIDLADTASIPGVLEKVDGLAKEIDVVHFNAATIKPCEPLKTPIEEIHEDFKIQNLAFYAVAQWAIPRLQALAQSKTSSNKPSLLVTNSHLQYEPQPYLMSLSLNKGAQRTMVDNLRRHFGDKEIHIGLITCEGPVAPENKHLNPSHIAEKAWEFYEQGEGLEVNIREEGLGKTL